MELQARRRHSGAMPRPPFFALSFVLPLVLATLPARAGDPAASAQSAMRCVHARVADPLLPVTANAEQIAQVALARCADEIEWAAADLVATDGHGRSGRIEAARIAVRRMLLDYAIVAWAAGASTEPSSSLDHDSRRIVD